MCFDERKCTFPLGAHQTHVRQRAITTVCSVDWRKGPHVEDLYYGLVCMPRHLSLNIWIVYRGTDLVVASIMRQYNIPDLLRYPIFGSFPSSWCSSPSVFLSDHCGSPITLSFPFGVARLSFALLVASNPSLQR